MSLFLLLPFILLFLSRNAATLRCVVTISKPANEWQTSGDSYRQQVSGQFRHGSGVFRRGLEFVKLAQRLLLWWGHVVQEVVEPVADHVLIRGQDLFKSLQRAVRLHAGQDDTGSVRHLHEEVEQALLKCLWVCKYNGDEAFVRVTLLIRPWHITHDVQEW